MGGIRRIPALDGIRGVAILLVIGRHYWQLPPGGGTVGVDLFFVLSGFLITALLLDEHEREGRISLRSFYVRRARRLLPALALTVGAYLVVAALQGRAEAALRAAAASAFYTANFAATFFPHLVSGEPLGPLWSLALEEQFYLVWPIALVLLLRFGVRRRVVAGLVGAGVVACCVERAWLFFHGADNVRIYTMPDSHCDNLLAGVLLAFVLGKWELRNGRLAVLSVALFSMLAAAGTVEMITGTLLDVVGVVLIAYALQPESWLARGLSLRPLVFVGAISYGLYLWHMVVLSWIHDEPLALALSVLIAYASWRWVEQPIRRRGFRAVLTGARPARAPEKLPASAPAG